MKKINFDRISVVAFVVAVVTACIAMVHYSYVWADEYSDGLALAMRIVAFAAFATIIYRFAEWREERRWLDEEVDEVMEEVERMRDMDYAEWD